MASRVNETHELGWVYIGYMQTALYLVEKMKEGDATDDQFHRRVPLYLCHHALEVLYKASLVDAGRKCPRTHNLKTLRDECLEFVSDANFPVPNWLVDVSPRTGDLFPDLPVMYFGNLHERARYISDNKGQRLQPPPDIDLDTMIEDIRGLIKSCGCLFVRLSWS